MSAFDWSLLRIPSQGESQASSAESSATLYSSASHDGLTDIEWPLESDSPDKLGAPKGPPPTPATPLLVMFAHSDPPLRAELVPIGAHRCPNGDQEATKRPSDQTGAQQRGQRVENRSA